MLWKDENPKLQRHDDDDEPKMGVENVIRLLIMHEPKMSIDRIHEILSVNGYRVSRFTVATVRMDFRHTLKFLRAEGVLSADLPPKPLPKWVRLPKPPRRYGDRFYYQ